MGLALNTHTAGFFHGRGRRVQPWISGVGRVEIGGGKEGVKFKSQGRSPRAQLTQRALLPKRVEAHSGIATQTRFDVRESGNGMTGGPCIGR